MNTSGIVALGLPEKKESFLDIRPSHHSEILKEKDPEMGKRRDVTTAALRGPNPGPYKSYYARGKTTGSPYESDCQQRRANEARKHTTLHAFLVPIVKRTTNHSTTGTFIL